MVEFCLILLAAVTTTAPTASSSPILYVLGAFLGGGALTVLYNTIQRWRKGQVEDTELINRITQQTIKGADDILAQYRLEVEVVKRQVEDYRIQLHDLTKELFQATLRITTLEKELEDSRTDHAFLVKELASATLVRDKLKAEISLLQRQIDSMQVYPQS